MASFFGGFMARFNIGDRVKSNVTAFHYDEEGVIIGRSQIQYDSLVPCWRVLLDHGKVISLSEKYLARASGWR